MLSWQQGRTVAVACWRGPGRVWPWGQSLAVGQIWTVASKISWWRGCLRMGTDCTLWRNHRALRSSKIQIASALRRYGWRASGTWNQMRSPSHFLSRCSTASRSLSSTASRSPSSTTFRIRLLLGETRLPKISEVHSFVTTCLKLIGCFFGILVEVQEGPGRVGSYCTSWVPGHTRDDGCCCNGMMDTVTHSSHIHTVLNLLCQAGGGSRCFVVIS